MMKNSSSAPVASPILKRITFAIHKAIGTKIRPMANQTPLDGPLLSSLAPSQYGEPPSWPPKEATFPLRRGPPEAALSEGCPHGLTSSPGEISIDSGLSSTSLRNYAPVLNHAPEMPEKTFLAVNAFLWSHVFGMTWKAARAVAQAIHQSWPQMGKCPYESSLQQRYSTVMTQQSESSEGFSRVKVAR